METRQNPELALISSFRNDFKRILDGIKKRTAEVREYKMFEEIVTNFSNMPAKNSSSLMLTKLFPVLMEKQGFSDMYEFYEKTKKPRYKQYEKEIKEFKKIISLVGKAVLQIMDEIIVEK